MRLGSITQTAWRRSVGKQFHTEDDKAGSQGRKLLFPLGREENCSGVKGSAYNGNTEAVTWSSAAATGDLGNLGFYAALKAAGDLAAHGIRAEGISAAVQVPVRTEETELRRMAAGIAEAGKKLKLPVTCFQGEASPAVSSKIVTVTAAGRLSMPENEADGQVYFTEAIPGQELILCGYTGLEGTLRILEEAEEELGKRFTPAFLRQAARLKEELVMPEQILQALLAEKKVSARPDMEKASVRPDKERIHAGTEREKAALEKGGISAVRQIGSGGILAALWEMAEMADAGLEADMSRMTLKQETVEICEYYQLNPYLLASAGSYLIAADDADQVIAVLEKAGARAGRLGVIRPKGGRVITSGEEVRYLDRPAPDELMRWWSARIQMSDGRKA